MKKINIFFLASLILIINTPYLRKINAYTVEEYVNEFSKDSWKTTDPAYFDYVKGTKWEFQYSHNGTSYTDAISIGSQTMADTNGNIVFLCTCNNKSGIVITDRYNAYVCMIPQEASNDPQIITYYYFSGAITQGGGMFLYYDKSNASNSYQESFQYKKTGSSDTDPNQPDTQPDQPQDPNTPPKASDPDSVFRFNSEEGADPGISGCFISIIRR